MTERATDTPVVVGLGEVLWDVISGNEKFGGAPANFACHAAGLGCQAYLVSAVGDDEPGKAAIATLREKGVRTDCVQVTPVADTGRVNVNIDGDGQPDYEIISNVAWDRILWNEELESLSRKCHAVCFGTLAQRNRISRQNIRKFLAMTRPDCLRVLDINIRQSFYDSELIVHSLKLANMLKLNEEELPIVCQAARVNCVDVHDSIKSLALQFNLKIVALTCGAQGSTIYADEKFSSHLPRDLIEITDTVGAGDAFTAATVVGYLNGQPLVKISEAANQIAAYVCTKPGATPVLPKRFRRQVKQNSSVRGVESPGTD